jgi:alpha-1,2-mannosyltransferase
MRMLAAMVCDAEPAMREGVWRVGIVALLLASRYIVRDLNDGGPNLILLALAMGGVYLACGKREVAAAGCLGAAAALKATAGIFIPFLLWKRCWRFAAYTTAAFALWVVLPILWIGPWSWWTHQREWFDSAVGFAAGFNPAAVRYYGDQNILNQALRPAIEHLMATRLSPFPAYGWTVSAAFALIILVIFGWLTRYPYVEHFDIAWLTETSSLLILATLLAPIAWVQHLVLAIPAIYLIVADWVAQRNFGVAPSAAMVLYIILALLLNRAILGKPGYLVLLDYHVHTICMLLIFYVLMTRYHAASRPRG